MDQGSSSSPGVRPDVVVVGGGMAGMAAACRLVDLGATVTLVEKRPFLGGRVYSFPDAEVDWEVDNGQHIFVGAFRAFIAFLHQIGSAHQTVLQPRLHIPVLSGAGKEGAFTDIPVPAPFAFLPTLLRYSHLRLGARFRVVGALALMSRTSRRRHPELEDITFYRWLTAHGQAEEAIDRFWNLILLPILNDDVRVVSADIGFMVFQEGLFRTRRAPPVGYARVGLSPVAGQACERYLRERGCRLLLGRAVVGLEVEGDRVDGVLLAGGETIQAQRYVSALPADALLSLLPPRVAEGPFFSRAAGITWAPIVNVHLWYDRPVADFDFAAYLDTPVQWVFHKSRMSLSDGSTPSYLDISLSGAWQYMDRAKGELVELFASEVARLLPRAREARLLKARVIKEPRATFRPLPGNQRHRLPARTPLANLFLAGEWTDTGWPSTMEGAVRSGNTAAGLLMEELQR